MSSVLSALNNGSTPLIVAQRSGSAPQDLAEARHSSLVIRHFCRRYLWDARGRWRIFNDPQYRVYRSNSGPPLEEDIPWFTSASLPATSEDGLEDGTWFISVSYFNGVYDSGFLPLGPRGETYIRLDVSSLAVLGAPPYGPISAQLIQRAAGVVEVTGFAFQSGALRPTEWALRHTIDGSDPPESDPTIMLAMVQSGLAVLSYTFVPGAGVTLKVRVQTRRNDGTTEAPVWRYSASTIVSLVAAAAVTPSAPLGASQVPGPIATDD